MRCDISQKPITESDCALLYKLAREHNELVKRNNMLQDICSQMFGKFTLLPILYDFPIPSKEKLTSITSPNYITTEPPIEKSVYTMSKNLCERLVFQERMNICAPISITYSFSRNKRSMSTHIICACADHIETPYADGFGH